MRTLLAILLLATAAEAECYPPCGMGSTLNAPAENPCPCPDDGTVMGGAPGFEGCDIVGSKIVCPEKGWEPQHPETSFVCFERKAEMRDACDLVHYEEFKALEERVRALEEAAKANPPRPATGEGCWCECSPHYGPFCVCADGVDVGLEED